MTYYGCLDCILVCILPDTSFWGSELRGSTRLLAYITPAATDGKDATKEQVLFYSRQTTGVITDLRSVGAVIGRVPTRGKFGIIDRSGSMAQTSFT